MKFILFAHARSGSTLLTSSLSEHKELKLQHELLNNNYYESIDWRIDNLGKTFKNIDKIYNFKNFLDKVFKIVDGFKILEKNLNHTQIENVVNYVNENNIMTIILKRKDLLKCIISSEICRKTNIWQNVDFKTNQKEIKIEIKKTVIDWIMNDIYTYWKILDKINPKQKIEIEYEKMISDWDNTLNNVQEKLKINNEKLPMKIGKLMENHNQYVENYEEINKYFNMKYKVN